MFKKINDLLALLIAVVIIPAFWILDGLKVLEVNGEVLGATIATWTLIVQYYFRKKPSDVDAKPPGGTP
jgi:hypothetical protein